MYIIEKLIKIFCKFRINENTIQEQIKENNLETEDVLTCNHIFMPIDSEKKFFACTKCGYLTTKSRILKSHKIKKNN